MVLLNDFFLREWAASDTRLRHPIDDEAMVVLHAVFLSRSMASEKQLRRPVC